MKEFNKLFSQFHTGKMNAVDTDGDGDDDADGDDDDEHGTHDARRFEL